jgi:hypothetical protein
MTRSLQTHLRHEPSALRRSFSPSGALAVLLAFALTSCGVLRSAAEAPGRIAGAVLPDKEPERPPAAMMLASLLRYSDIVVVRVDHALVEFERVAGTREAEIQAARWRVDVLRWGTQLAAGPNSLTSLLDLLVALTVQRWLLEDHWIPEVWGEAARPMHAAIELSEHEGWSLSERYLTPEQVEKARLLLARWRTGHPDLEPGSLVAFPTFQTLVEPEEDPDAVSLFGAFGLDPLSGLEPASREIEQARQFGERALFSLQRAPRILGAELDLRQHEARTELSAVTDELAAELTAQRAGLLADIEAAHAPLGELLAEARATLEAGEQTSRAITTGIATLDGFVARFDDSGEAPVEADEPRGEPFDVTDYGVAAERIGVAARDLTTLPAELDARLPEARALLDETAARGTATVERALLGVLLVGLALIAAAALAAWLVRRRPRSRAG